MRQIQEIERIRDRSAATPPSATGCSATCTEQNGGRRAGEMRLWREREPGNRRRAELRRERAEREGGARERARLVVAQLVRRAPDRLRGAAAPAAEPARPGAPGGCSPTTATSAAPSQIAQIEEHRARIGELDADLAGEARLVELERARNDEARQAREGAQRARPGAGEPRPPSRALASAAAPAAPGRPRFPRSAARDELAASRSSRAIRRSAFAQLRGKLSWPTDPRTVARWPNPRRRRALTACCSGGRSRAPVRAIYHGRVVYADWLAGLGLLVIVDHGRRLLSLYGHNDELYKKVGEARHRRRHARGRRRQRRAHATGVVFRAAARQANDPRPWFRNPRP